MINSTLKQKTIKGISWNLIDRFGNQFIKLIISVILARLLTPEDFGLIGIIMITFALSQVFITGGFGEAFIQKKEVTDLDACTVFYTNVFVSIMIYGILWIASPFIAKFYSQSELLLLIRVMGLILNINAFNVIPIAQLTRAVNFKRNTMINLASLLASGIVGISAAYYGYGVWSLVIQQMTNRSLVTLGLWVTSKWKLTAQYSIKSLKNMFSFGIWILCSQILKTIFDNIYILTIGKLFPISHLGYYTQAKRFQQLSSTQISGAVGAVVFPIFSQLQDDKEKLRNSVSKVLTYTMFLIMPLLVTLMIVAKSFVIVILTEKWIPIIQYLQLLCIVGILYPIHTINIQVLLAQGKSDLNFKLTLIINSLRIINIISMYRFGIIFIIVGEVFISFTALFINTYYTKKFINHGIINQWRDIKQIVFGCIIAGLTTSLVTSIFINQFAILIVGGIMMPLLFIRYQYYFNINLVKEVFSLRKFLIK